MLAAALNGPLDLLQYTDLSQLTLQDFGLRVGLIGLLIYLLAIISVALAATSIGSRKEGESSNTLWLIGLGCLILLLGLLATYLGAVGAYRVVKQSINPSPAELQMVANSCAMGIILGCAGCSLNLLLSLATYFANRNSIEPES